MLFTDALRVAKAAAILKKFSRRDVCIPYVLTTKLNMSARIKRTLSATIIHVRHRNSELGLGFRMADSFAN